MKQVDMEKAKNFWTIMCQFYGNTWSREYGKAPTKPWISLLTDYEQGDIDQAVKYLIGQPKSSSSPRWPVNLPDFAYLLKQTRSAKKIQQGYEPPAIKLASDSYAKKMLKEIDLILSDRSEDQNK